MKKKIFILTGEVSGDKLASKVIGEFIKKKNDVELLSVGGEHLKALKIKSIYNLSEITYLGFTNVLLNIFNISRKINETTNKIIEFNPDVLFSVDSPDFTLRVAQKVKQIKPKIKIVHLVAPQVWIWRKNRLKKMKHFIDHVLLLFPFEKKYFDKENINSTFIGHPLLQDEKSEVDISKIIDNKMKIFSIFPGSRLSEIKILTPILFSFIKKMNKKYKDLFFFFHSTAEHLNKIQTLLNENDLNNCKIVTDEQIKSQVLKSSIFAVAKSGTISLEICKAKVPSVIIYKMNLINFSIIKMLVKVRFANIINIAADSEIIPELLQSKCNSKNIFNVVDKLLNDKKALQKQILDTLSIINKFKTDKPDELASSVLINHL